MKEDLNYFTYPLFRSAIKRIPLDINDKDLNIDKKMREVDCLIQYNHENIVKYFEHFEMSNILYIVTEYCEV
jgi:serine/threonine protein kinase